jgi:hypothetical protein
VTTLQFVDDLIGHIAWPIVVLVALIAFRRELTKKLAELSSADFSVGGSHFSFGFSPRKNTKAELDLVAADVKIGSTLTHRVPAAPSAPEEEIAIEESTVKLRSPQPIPSKRAKRTVSWAERYSDEQWAEVRGYLSISPHYAVHLAGQKVEGAISDLLGSNAPTLPSLVRPRYLADQGVVTSELADASFRLLRLRNAVASSPKFFLSQDNAVSFVNQAEAVVKALIQSAPA